jgi:hypothetical protein
MRWKLAVTLLVLAGPLSAAETAKVPGHQWVTVKNLEPIKSGNARYSFGDMCSLLVGGTASKIAEDPKTNLVLVRYEIPDVVYGARCPSGTLFEVPAAHFASMTEQAEAAIAADKADRDRIARLLH